MLLHLKKGLEILRIQKAGLKKIPPTVRKFVRIVYVFCISARTGVEFLRRFAMHILPRRFVKIRYFGILTSGYKQQVKLLKTKADIVQLTETKQQRLVRLTGFDPCQCPKCKTGKMQAVEILPRIRSPGNVFYPRTQALNL